MRYVNKNGIQLRRYTDCIVNVDFVNLGGANMRKSKDFYTTQKLFTIYALVVEDQGDTLVFIWKTSSKNLKAVLRRHLRGEVSFTKVITSFAMGGTIRRII